MSAQNQNETQRKAQFIESVRAGYAPKGAYMALGKAKLSDEVVAEAEVKLALSTFNRHGLISGSTGSGKTKTLQILAENLSAQGVPCLLMDIKGDLSGIAKAGDPANLKIQERHGLLGIPYEAKASPVELFGLGDEARETPLRATVSEFGPLLLSRVLGLSDVQEGVLAVLFKYCDDQGLPLLDLEDLKTALNYLSGAGKTELSAEYGSIAPATVGALLRKVVALEQEGGGRFFGEPSFEVTDLLRVDAQGRGVLGVLRLVDLQDKPKLFSTFMLSLLAELYENLPEAGDLDRPKLVLFIDEAHLVFKEASRALLDQLETVVKLIRSKGVGIFFCTQLPGDIPMEVLSQLGLKIQHSLRAFTARDRKDIRLVAENYPLTDYYDVEQLITQLGIGEALVTGLNEKGVPTPLLHTYLIAPASRMDVLSEAELSELLRASALNSKYRKSIDRDSAHEILEQKMRQAAESSPEPAEKKARKPSRPEPSALDKVLKSPVARSMGIAIAGSLTRALLGAFKRR